MLKAEGLPIEEFPQTVGGTTRMGQTLFDLLNGKNLRLYPSDELRAQALNTVAVESARSFRIAKEKASRKIDAVVALTMACVAALDGRPVGAQVFGITPDELDEGRGDGEEELTEDEEEDEPVDNEPFWRSLYEASGPLSAWWSL